MLGVLVQQSSTIVKASYFIAMLIAKKIKPFSDGELVKDCLVADIKYILFDKSKLFILFLKYQYFMPKCHRMENISAEIVVNLGDKTNQFKTYSLVFDEGRIS